MSTGRTTCHYPITCRYLHYRLPNGKTILLPLIQVELVSEKESLTTIGLLDTGATDSFMPYEIADILGSIPESPKKEPVETAGGSTEFFPVVLKRLSLLTGGKIFSDFPNFQMLVPAKPERDLPYTILGRDSIFKRFYITFKENIKKFVIEHHKYARRRGKWRARIKEV